MIFIDELSVPYWLLTFKLAIVEALSTVVCNENRHRDPIKLNEGKPKIVMAKVSLDFFY